MKYVALLRGINVGKSTQVPMKTLSARLAELGLSNVVTYLNSGNVVFESALGVAELTQRIEDELEVLSVSGWASRCSLARLTRKP